MILLTHTQQIRSLRSDLPSQGRTLAFVPTMGNLHQGHLQLVKQAQKLADQVVVSIYVNPLQFAAGEDLESYPRTLEQDQQKLRALGVDFLYLPDTKTLYPEGLEAQSKIVVPQLDGIHCAKSRPHFFTGVATVVTKLFNLVSPDYAIFGEKDFQQLAIVRKLVKDLCLPIKIIGVPIERNPNGLALSSRNGYLSPEQLQLATQLYQTLKNCKKSILAKEASFDQLERKAITHLTAAGFKVDYFSICQQKTLRQAATQDKDLVILAAAWVDKTRLIDNIAFNL